MKSPPGARVGVPIALLLCYAVALITAVVLYAPCDDTFIYLVYAKNYLAGHGLTYNGMKVQGFTSVLWMWLIVLVGKAGIALPHAANALSAASGLLALATTFFAGTVMGLGWQRALVPPLLVATTGDFGFYMGVGLESVFFTGMLVWSVSYACRKDAAAALESWGLPVVLVVTILARPEGALITAIVLVVLLVETRRVLLVARAAAVVAVVLVPVLLWARGYYGSWLPNTFYAKSGAGLHNLSQGATYLFNFFLSTIPVFLFAAYSLVFRKSGFGRAEKVLALVIVVWFLNVARQGGDNMVGYRALLPVLPLLYLLFVRLYPGAGVRQVAYGALVIAVFNVVVYRTPFVKGSSWNLPVQRQIRGWNAAWDVRKDIGLYLRDIVPPNESIAVNAAGIVPYFAERSTIDMIGLNNSHIARRGRRDFGLPYGHQVGDGTYVLSQQPAVILFTIRPPDWRSPAFVSDQDIFANPTFRQRYRPGSLPHGRIAFFRSDIADRLAGEGR